MGFWCQKSDKTYRARHLRTVRGSFNIRPSSLTFLSGEAHTPTPAGSKEVGWLKGVKALLAVCTQGQGAGDLMIGLTGGRHLRMYIEACSYRSVRWLI